MPDLLAAYLLLFWPTHSASAPTGTAHAHTHTHTHTHTYTHTRTHIHTHTHRTHARTHTPNQYPVSWCTGATVRVDTTLLGFKNMSWQRGNQSFVFKGRGERRLYTREGREGVVAGGGREGGRKRGGGSRREGGRRQWKGREDCTLEERERG